jgi:hypothetical protein
LFGLIPGLLSLINVGDGKSRSSLAKLLMVINFNMNSFSKNLKIKQNILIGKIKTLETKKSNSFYMKIFS